MRCLRARPILHRPAMRHALRSALILLVALAASGCYAVQKSGDYYGIDTALPNRGVVFVVDVSGSMEGKQEGSVEDLARGAAARTAGRTVERSVGGRVGRLLGGQVRGEATKLGAAKRELIPVIRGLDASSRFTVVTFGSRVDPWRGSLVGAGTANKNLATAHVNGLDANGGTPIREAMERAFQVPGVDVIFLMTDGQPTDSQPSQILSTTRGLNGNRRVTVHTVGLGPDQDRDFLRALATENGGVYIERD